MLPKAEMHRCWSGPSLSNITCLWLSAGAQSMKGSPRPPAPPGYPHFVGQRESALKQHMGLTSVVVNDYDAAISFFVDVLGFDLIEDTYVPEQDKRWVVVAPQGAIESRILLARAANDEQATRVGNQTGGRVFLFLYTDDFWRDYEAYKAKGLEFVRPPKEESYGTVAVFKDVAGNMWDLLQPR